MAVKDDRWLNEAIASLDAQTFRDFEMVLIVDHVGHGLAHCLNRAARLARGYYLARLDADDLAYRHRFQQQVTVLNAYHNINILGSWATLITQDGDRIGTFAPNHDNYPWRNPLIHSSVMARREVFEEAGGYDETLSLCQDFDLWLRIGSLAILPEPLVFLRQHAGQMSRRTWARRYAQWIIRRRWANTLADTPNATAVR